MRIEYMRTLAAAHRWPEEVNLLSEEMARTLIFLTYEEVVWLQRVLGAQRGPRVFALRQARDRRRIRAHFQKMWAVFGDSQALEAALCKRLARKRKLKNADSTEDAGHANEGQLQGGDGGNDEDEDAE